MSATDPFEVVLERLDTVSRNGTTATARCPTHPDSNPSLSVARGDRQPVVITCHAGCSTQTIVEALGLRLSDLSTPGNGQRQEVRRTRYPYVDEHGEVLYYVVRTEPGRDGQRKSFHQVPVSGASGPGAMKGVRRTLYRLPEVLTAIRDGATVFVVEGEKDVDVLAAAGYCATCNPGGAGKWHAVPDAAAVLAGADVMICVDDDPPGWQHARQVAASLQQTAAAITVLGPAIGRDVAEHLGAGRSVEDLLVVASSDPAVTSVGVDDWLGADDGGHHAAATTDDGSVDRYTATRIADVDPEHVTWLWPGRLPAGKLVVLDGDPSVGKSTLMLDVAARVTSGRPLPGEHLASVRASNVVLLAAEDGLADTIRPRLDAAGADTTRVHHLDAVPRVDDEGHVTWLPPTIPDDLAAIEALIVDTGAVLVVIDVLMAYLSGRHDSHRDQDVRRALAQLAAVAERTGACIVLLRHLRKTRGSAMYAGGGSIGIIGVARAGLVAAVDPEDDTGARRVLAATKCNLSAPPTALAYQLTADPDRDAARIEWLGPTTHTADALMVGPQSDETRSEVQMAKDFLREYLAVDGHLSSEVFDVARNGHDITEKTLRRAQKALGVEAYQRDRKWWWRLPSAASDGQPERGHLRLLTPDEEES